MNPAGAQTLAAALHWQSTASGHSAVCGVQFADCDVCTRRALNSHCTRTKLAPDSHTHCTALLRADSNSARSEAAKLALWNTKQSRPPARCPNGSPSSGPKRGPRAAQTQPPRRRPATLASQAENRPTSGPSPKPTRLSETGAHPPLSSPLSSPNGPIGPHLAAELRTPLNWSPKRAGRAARPVAPPSWRPVVRNPTGFLWAQFDCGPVRIWRGPQLASGGCLAARRAPRRGPARASGRHFAGQSIRFRPGAIAAPWRLLGGSNSAADCLPASNKTAARLGRQPARQRTTKTALKGPKPEIRLHGNGAPRRPLGGLAARVLASRGAREEERPLAEGQLGAGSPLEAPVCRWGGFCYQPAGQLRAGCL